MVIEDSKRTPWRRMCDNMADLIERNLETDGFRYWGITMYRTTYKSDADWAKFLDRFMGSVRTELESDDGLDMLDSFRPVVMEDARRFDGATPDQIRDAFKEWARVACETEQGVPYKRAEWAYHKRFSQKLNKRAKRAEYTFISIFLKTVQTISSSLLINIREGKL